MTTIVQSDHNYPIQYPFENSIDPYFERLMIKDIPPQYIGINMYENLYPHVRADQVAYMSGVSKEKWNDFYKSIYIMCCEFQIRNLIIVWSSEIFVRIYIEDFNWRKFHPIPPAYRESLTYDYNIGFCVGLCNNSVRRTIEMNPYPVPYQMYFNADSKSKLIPNFNDVVIPAFDIAQDKYIFAHSSNILSLAHYNDVNYIKKALCHATANGMKGVVFHCGYSTTFPVSQALQMLANNIVSGIKSALFSPEQRGTAKFILETPAGKGTEVLTDINHFIHFCSFIKTTYPEIAPYFSICVDTCHVHQCGYAPHKYLEEIHKIHPVDFVHFNDSMNGWCCRKDKHARPGEGHIPWPFLTSVAEFCKKNNIPAVFEN